MKIEFCVHAWSMQLPQYATLLNYQLSSLVLHPPKNCELEVTICCAFEDDRVASVIKFFSSKLNICPFVLPKESLVRRAIGRNTVALQNTSDWVWMGGCDYVFRDNCFDVLAEKLAGVKTDLAFPAIVNRHRTHAIGDDYVARSNPPEITDINEADFEASPMDRAIGCLQICRGSRLREIGYCRDMPQFQRPERIWMRTKEDVAFRKTIGPATAVDIPGVHRLRHSLAGRDYHTGKVHG